MIFGVGGVGSHVLTAIARSGVRRIAIIDFDRVTLSSLNRHSFATRKHVGRSKVEVFKEFLAELNPNIELEVYETYATESNIATFFNEKPDYVIDCIDNMDAKAALVTYCVQNNIRIIVCCGAGMKADPTRIQIRDMSDTCHDDLARALRMRLKHKQIKTGVKMVYSQEQTHRELLPLKEHQKGNVDDYRVFSNYRIRIVPVFSCMPALLAYSISSYVLCELAEQTYTPYVIEDVKSTHYARFYNQVCNSAKRLGKFVDVDMEDIYVLAREVYEFRCLITNRKASQLEMVIWDITKEVDIYNLTLLYGEHAEKHKRGEIWDNDVKQAKLLMDQKLREFLNRKVVMYK